VCERERVCVRRIIIMENELKDIRAHMMITKKKIITLARSQVIMENDLNMKELPKDLEILNPVFMN
jgi:hypothetical protein